ncbi:MAG: M48 family metalloprotease, partial [Alphaproteobacteria bacterium]|nr:M48 family metalloprotease [Alphaproteobacteria bacterium]
MKIRLLGALLLGFACFSFAPALAQTPEPQLPPRAAPTTRIESSALPVIDATPAFDARRATAIYLSRVSGEARARSDAYFEGGYGLQLLDLLWALGIAGLLLFTGLSTRLRDWAEERTHSRSTQVILYGAGYIAAVTLLTLPLTLYEGFFREHAYGLSNQSFWAWAGDFGIEFLLTLMAGMVMLPIFYAAVRAAGRDWWLWGAGLTILLLILQLAIYPVFVAPLFNHVETMPDSPLQRQIVALAHANQIPAEAIYVNDASRQSNRISANVSGFLGTARITLTDNLLKQATPAEVLALVGHEMGHYVMGHTLRIILLLGLVIMLGFGFIGWSFSAATDFFGGAWQLRKVEDVAGLPLLMALASLFLFVATPLTNSITRSAEAQADIFGLNAVRQPDAFATVMLKLS